MSLFTSPGVSERIRNGIRSDRASEDLQFSLEAHSPSPHSTDCREINGPEAIAYFRTQYPNVLVVVLTGYPDLDLAVSLIKQGVLDYLVKPVSKEELLTVISKSVNNHVILDGPFTA
jgi:DNA-binding NtrC family response regulator